MFSGILFAVVSSEFVCVLKQSISCLNVNKLDLLFDFKISYFATKRREAMVNTRLCSTAKVGHSIVN